MSVSTIPCPVTALKTNMQSAISNFIRVELVLLNTTEFPSPFSVSLLSCKIICY